MTTVAAVPERFPIARVAWRMIAAVLVGCIVAPAARAQGTKGVSFQPGRHGNKLSIDLNGKNLSEWTVTSIPDTIIITVTPQDSLGNPIPLVGYEIQVWDDHVLGLIGSTIGANQAVSKIVPRNKGQTTIQVRGSGVRSWVLVELGPSTLGIGPRGEPMAQGGPSNNVMTAGGRLSYALYNYDFHNQTAIDGKGGVVLEGYIGRDYDFGLTLVLGAGLGFLSADSLGTSVTAHELEAYLRGDYAFMRESRVRPVVSLAGGVYRIRTGGGAPGIWNTSIFMVFGGGVDYTLSPKAVGEFRVSSQQLFEQNSQFRLPGGASANGYVGNLLVIGAGVRFAL
jgi:hypothetical protein